MNFRFFQDNIDEFLSKYPTYFAYLPTRIMNNCILLPIEAESQDTALRIFSTLNDRGKPLSDADIFKAQFYKHFSKLGKKEEFITQWKKLEELCERIFHPISGTPMDELFTRYMYFVRAKMGIVSSTTEALRKFYEKNSYALLKDANTLTELIVLAEFWEDVSNQDTERFSNRVLKQFFVLNYAPNGMWTYFVSVYFMQNKDDEGFLDDEKFYTFLQKITGFIWTYAITNPGVNALRTPVYAEMVNIVNDKRFTFVRSNFRYLHNFLRYYDVEEIDGLLADLGVSSHHFDDSERGFSFRFDGKLDMRMNKRSGMTAADIVNTYEEERLADIFYLYGELKNSRKLASVLVKARAKKEFVTINDFLEVVKPLYGREREKKELAKVFQALRIEVNQEMEALKEMLYAAANALKPGGRLVVITYHSLEDRMVKNIMKTGNIEGKAEKDFYGNIQSPFRLVNNKVIVPSDDEINTNPRSRSAKLRIAEKK